MFKFGSSIKPASVAIVLGFSTLSLNAHATLSSYTMNGVDLVYSSVSDVTWTQDANLLGTLFATQGFNTVVNDIIAASSGKMPYTVSVNDFSSNGQTTWWGAEAYVNYLNSIDYGGSNQWRLPTVATQISQANTPSNGTTPGNEGSELFYQELGGSAWGYIPNSSAFNNLQFSSYWSGTVTTINVNYAWNFDNSDGVYGRAYMGNQLFAWAVTPGQITLTPVPEPESVAMLLFGLGLVGSVLRLRRG